MQTRITYVGTLNGVHGMWVGFKPEGVIVEEERVVLYADKGKILSKNGEIIGTTVWLKNGDTQDNYTEIEYQKPAEPRRDKKNKRENTNSDTTVEQLVNNATSVAEVEEIKWEDE